MGEGCETHGDKQELIITGADLLEAIDCQKTKLEYFSLRILLAFFSNLESGQQFIP